MTNAEKLVEYFKDNMDDCRQRGFELPSIYSELYLDAWLDHLELFADKFAQLGCDKCCVGCKLYCRDTNHGDKSCADTIEEWLRQEAPRWPWEE